MNTFFDMRNYLLELYREVSSSKDNSDSLVELGDDDIDELISSQELEIASDMTDTVLELPDDELENLISLIVLYYMARNISVLDIDKSALDDELIDMILNQDKDYVISALKNSDSGYLFELVYLILEEDIKLYGAEVLLEGVLEDYNYYAIIDEALKNNEVMSELFDKYHPNMNLESKNYNKYKRNEMLIEKYSNMKIKSLGEFTLVFTNMKNNLNNEKYLQYFLEELLTNIKENNSDLHQNIVLFILRYYYIDSYLNKTVDFDSIKFEILDIIQSMRIDDGALLDDAMIKLFCKFDFNTYMNSFNKLPKEVVLEVEDIISLENIKMYGINGKWVKYSEEDMNKIFKYSPLWFPIDMEDDKTIEIYYSEDKNGEFKIPRIFLVSDTQNNIIDVMGRDDGVVVEFEMLDILKDKVSNASNYGDFSKELNSLIRLGKINEKIDSNLELNREDIEFLYEINEEISKTMFSHLDSRYEIVREKSNIRHDLAVYFNCLDSEVALIEEELNENTVVSLWFYPKEEKCYYPKLRVIFGDAYGSTLKSVRGLQKLEYIKGNAFFDSISDTLGLENLKRVDGDLLLSSLNDTSHLNNDLVVLGETNIPSGCKVNKKKYNN